MEENKYSGEEKAYSEERKDLAKEAKPEKGLAEVVKPASIFPAFDAKKAREIMEQVHDGDY